MMDIRFDNDLVVERGDLATVDDPEASGQRIRDRLLTFRGEWFLDLGFGVPYYGNILVKSPRMDVIAATLKTEILKSADGQFTAFDAAIDSRTRKLTVNATISLAAGGQTTVGVTI